MKLVPVKETWSWWMVKCRPSAAACAASAAWAGMNRATASATSRSSCAGPIRWANPATWASTNPAASRLSPRVAAAIRRAFHATSPCAWTLAQTRGRRYFSSTPWAINARPESVDIPNATASSATQNSATSGAPGPPNPTPTSPPGVQVAASWIDSAGCCSAHTTAPASTEASATSATTRCERTKPSTSAALSSTAVVMSRVVVIEPSQAATTDSFWAQNPH